MLGLGTHRRSQPIVAQEGARHPAGVQGECGDVWATQCLELHRSGFTSHPMMEELPQGVPEAAGGSGSGSAVGWAVPGEHCSQCPVLPAAGQRQLLIALSPTIVPSC